MNLSRRLHSLHLRVSIRVERGPVAKIFLSYSRIDLARIEPLANALEKQGHEVWWDRRLTGGSEFDEAIEKALAEADVVVVGWSEAASRSAWVRDEAGVGRDRHRLVPLTLDGSLPPLGFRQFHTIDLSAWSGRRREAEFAAIVRAIAAAATEKDLPEVPTPSAPRRTGASAFSRRHAIIAGALSLTLLGGGLGAWSWSNRVMAKPLTLGFAGFRVIGSGVDPGFPLSFDQEVRTAFSDQDIELLGSGADLQLRGSVEHLPDGMRLTASLDDARHRTTLWTQSVDVGGSTQATAHEAAQGIAATLDCVVDGTARGRRPEDAVLSLFIQACSLSQVPPGGQMVDLGRKMVARSPDFVGGWWAIAEGAVGSTLIQLSPGMDRIALDDKVRDQGAAAARQIIRLDPRNAEGYRLLAQLLPASDALGRDRLLHKAIASRPEKCACSYQHLGDFLIQSGRFDEALSVYRRGVDQQPGISLAVWRTAMGQDLTGRKGSAAQTMTGLEKLVGGLVIAQRKRPLIAMWDGRWKDAVGRLQVENPENQKALDAALAALASGNEARIQAAGARFERIPVRLENEWVLVPILASLGRSDAVFVALDASLRQQGFYSAPGRLPGMSNPLLFDPRFRSVWNDPRFAAYLRKAGFITYWKSSHSKPDACSAPNAPRFCALLN